MKFKNKSTGEIIDAFKYTNPDSVKQMIDCWGGIGILNSDRGLHINHRDGSYSCYVKGTWIFKENVSNDLFGYSEKSFFHFFDHVVEYYGAVDNYIQGVS